MRNSCSSCDKHCIPRSLEWVQVASVVREQLSLFSAFKLQEYTGTTPGEYCFKVEPVENIVYQSSYMCIE